MSAQHPPTRRRLARWLLLALAVTGVAGAVVFSLDKGFLRSDPPPPLPKRDPDERTQSEPAGPLELASGRRLTLWWDSLPTDIASTFRSAGRGSNIHPDDYIGPAACQKCHPKNYRAWSTHPHRWMNALASEETVKGDFSGAALSYLSGRATFERREDGGYFMRLERGGVRRTYRVTQTIGRRFFQYYVGKQIEGPEPPAHHFYHKDHVLPFGYWLDEKEWGPVVHIGPERPDGERPDPFAPPDSGQYYAEYSVGCNACHTTFPLADLFGRRSQQIGEHAPVSLHWSLRQYLESAHPVELRSIAAQLQTSTGQNPMADWEATRYAVTLGVSCEACHLGARVHARNGGDVLPRFFPRSPHLFVEKGGKDIGEGRTHDNVNWACGRCHTGERPAFAAGMSTWNSVEYDDAMRGSCYTQLRCIDCHDPHKAIGPKWSAPPDRDDAVCLKCHKRYEPAAQRQAHTHHPAGSAGSRCLNCHMPRINEGLQDVVRTHMIYSPTRADMIQANQPNACNLCHVDKPIDWTLQYLKEWYGRSYDEEKIAANHPNRDQLPAALGWLQSSNESVRLVAADALIRARDWRALGHLFDALDDPYLLNRQFAMKGLQEMLGQRLADFGYRYYMTRDERRRPLADLRAKWRR
jgi:predicted CXXCH cytochrome family protein